MRKKMITTIPTIHEDQSRGKYKCGSIEHKYIQFLKQIISDNMADSYLFLRIFIVIVVVTSTSVLGGKLILFCEFFCLFSDYSCKYLRKAHIFGICLLCETLRDVFLTCNNFLLTGSNNQFRNYEFEFSQMFSFIRTIFANLV